jgi:hypothetical protein
MDEKPITIKIAPVLLKGMDRDTMSRFASHLRETLKRLPVRKIMQAKAEACTACNSEIARIMRSVRGEGS